jgi:hypothetical protein
MIRALMLSLLGVSITTTVYAGTQGDERRIVINKISETDFEVIDWNQSSPHAFWCGAASYIEVRIGQSELTPIYLKSSPGPSVTKPGKKGVIFTTSSEGLPPDPGGLDVGVDQPGQSMKSFQARGFCRDAFNRSTK